MFEVSALPEDSLLSKIFLNEEEFMLKSVLNNYAYEAGDNLLKAEILEAESSFDRVINSIEYTFYKRLKALGHEVYFSKIKEREEKLEELRQDAWTEDWPRKEGLVPPMPEWFQPKYN